MTPKQLEIFVGSILGAFYQCDVYHVGQTADDGIDLLAIVKDEPLLIQVKRRASTGASEGVNTVKLLFASAFGQKSSHGMVVTTAPKFTRPARKWAASPPLIDAEFRLQLVDFSSLMSMVNCVAVANGLPAWEAHQNSLRPWLSIPRSRKWKHYLYENCDVMIHNESDQATAIVIGHKNLEVGHIFKGNSKTIKQSLSVTGLNAILKSARDLADRGMLRYIERRFDPELARELQVPFDICNAVGSRLLELYPTRVFELAP